MCAICALIKPRNFGHKKATVEKWLRCLISIRNKWPGQSDSNTPPLGRDARGLARLAEKAGPSWQGGILLYTGTSTLPLVDAPNTFAVPMNRLWENISA